MICKRLYTKQKGEIIEIILACIISLGTNIKGICSNGFICDDN